MKAHMWEDRFTPEGVPMTSPFECGMKGPQNWMYERERYKCGYEQEETKTPAPACR